MLAAYSLELGSVWIGAFEEDEVARILDLPDLMRPVAMVPIGYPDERPAPPGKVGRDQAIVHLR